MGLAGPVRAKKKPTTTTSSSQRKINQTEQLAGKAARTERAMERLDVVEQPREPWQLRLTIGRRRRSGDVVARLTDAVVDRGDFVLGPVTSRSATASEW